MCTHTMPLRNLNNINSHEACERELARLNKKQQKYPVINIFLRPYVSVKNPHKNAVTIIPENT